MPTSPIIELRGVSKSFAAGRNHRRQVAVFERLDLEIGGPGEGRAGGEFVALLGPSGCGKSTVLNLIAGLTPPDAGTVTVQGRAVTGPHAISATVPQAYTCFPWLTVLQNVEFGLRLERQPGKTCRRTAMEYIEKVDLLAFACAYPEELSGGMQQRVAIARTLAMKRPIVLMDEPFGALDAQTRSKMQQMLIRLWKSEGSTIVFVTHDLAEALLLAERIIVFSAGPARILDDIKVAFNHAETPGEMVNTPAFMTQAEHLRQLLGPATVGGAPAAPPGGASDEPA